MTLLLLLGSGGGSDGSGTVAESTGWTWTKVGTVLPTARLRGPRSQNWLLGRYVVISDLAKAETVKKWDGSTFGDFGHNLSSDLIAKYCRVHGERVYFANVRTTTDTPHVILASKLSDAETLTTANRPSSSLSDEDAFFLPTPDLRPVNGIEAGFGQMFYSTSAGQLHRLSGSSAQDFKLLSFYEGSSISGDEALVNIGNDILLGAAGRIETLSGTIKFGDVETDDVTRWIRPLVENVREWMFAYNRRLQKIYCLPDSGGLLWVLHKGLLNTVGDKSLANTEGENLPELKSPWSKWTTKHATAFSTSTMWTMRDPQSGLERTFFGDENGCLYAFEGPSGQDGAADFYVAGGAYFDGASALVRNSALIGAANSATGLLSFWINWRDDTSNTPVIFAARATSSGVPQIRVFFVEATGVMTITLTDLIGSASTSVLVTAGFLPDRSNHVIMAWDTNAVGDAKRFKIRINRAAPSYMVSNSALAFDVGVASADVWQIGARDGVPGTSGFLNADLSDIWFDTIPYYDIENPIHLDPFIDSAGRPVGLGDDGSEPFNAQPLLFFSGTAAEFSQNQGSGGDFTVTGELQSIDTTPSAVPFPQDIRVFRRSKVINLPGYDIFDVTGWILYQKVFATTVTLTFEYGGTNVFDQSITVRLPTNPVVAVYNGSTYYGEEVFYNVGFSVRLHRQKFSAAGQASHCQLRVEVDGARDVEISEVGVSFRAARSN